MRGVPSTPNGSRLPRGSRRTVLRAQARSPSPRSDEWVPAADVTTSFVFSASFLRLAVTVGVALRLVEYFSDRSLWVDESVVALNLEARSFEGLFHHLSFYVVAPVGFLALEKLVITLFGASEYALRAVPLVASLVALTAFVPLARRLLAPRVVPMAVLLFALSDPLIRYAGEAKQYESDVAVTVLLLLYATTRLLPPARLTWGSVIGFAILGLVAFFFAHPAIFVSAGSGSP